MKKVIMAVLLVGLCALLAAGCSSCPMCGHKHKADMAAKMKMQTTCPMTGNPIDKQYYVDAEGVRIYTCCPKCLSAVKADPKAAIQKLKDKGECCMPIPSDDK